MWVWMHHDALPCGEGPRCQRALQPGSPELILNRCSYNSRQMRANLAGPNGEGRPIGRPSVSAALLARLLLLDRHALESLVELGELAAAVHQAMHAGPGRVRLRID